MLPTLYENNFAHNMLKSLALSSLKEYYAGKEEEEEEKVHVPLQVQIEDNLIIHKILQQAFAHPIEWNA